MANKYLLTPADHALRGGAGLSLSDFPSPTPRSNGKAAATAAAGRDAGGGGCNYEVEVNYSGGGGMLVVVGKRNAYEVVGGVRVNLFILHTIIIKYVDTCQ